MTSTILFYTVFISQIIALSYYIPKKMFARMQYVFSTYPPAEYPRLYPRDTGYYDRYNQRFKLANILIFALGFVIIIASEALGYELKYGVGRLVVFVYAMLQFMPMIVLEISEYKRFKLMRRLKLETTRSANLKPRGFLDFISPVLLGAAVIMLFVACWFGFWINDFEVNWPHDAYEGTIILILTNLYFVLMVGWQVYGKKKDPYLAHVDRERQLNIVSTIAGGASISISLFYIATTLGDVYDLVAFEASISSLYFQLIGLFAFGIMLQAKNIDDMDFSVYKENGSSA